jgi:hypothetical protein
MNLKQNIYTESEQSLYHFFGICQFNATVPPGITETKRKILHIFFKFQYTKIAGKKLKHRSNQLNC